MPNDNDPPRERPWDRSEPDDDHGDRPRPRRRDDDYDDDRPRRRRDDYDDRPRDEFGGSERKDASNGLATAGLILGILSIFTLCLAGVPAIICSLLALGKPVGRGMAITGLLLGALGTFAGIGGGIWAFTVGTTRVRMAAARMSDQNNLKQIALGLHSEEWATGGMIGPYAEPARWNDNSHNKGLSWRVGVLPYIEQAALHSKFNMREAWDSPANRPLSNTVIKTYSTPFNEQPSNETPYRVFYGNGALFNEDGQPTRIAEITDGTSNTIMMVHAWDQVPWAAPKDFKYDPRGALPKFGHPNMRGGFNVAMADGSVRFVSDTVSDQVMHAAITRNGGEVLPLNW